MKKIYHILILLILSLSGYSQVYQSMPQYGYGPVKRFWVDSTLSIPTVCGVPTLKANVTKQAAIAFDSCNKRFYLYNPKTLTWDTIKGGGSAFDSTSLSNRINGKVDSVKRSSDSIYYYKNGVKYLAFRDSTQNGRWGNDTATVLLAKVHNDAGSQLTNGEVVYLAKSGTSSDVPSVKRAYNKADSVSANTFGFVTGTIANNDTGWVVLSGKIEKVNTSAFANGDILYLDSIAGKFTKTKPKAPYHLVYLGVVVKANAGNGAIFVKPQNGYELDEIHDVQINGVVNNQILVYSDTQKLWKNRSAYSVIDTTQLSNRIDQRVKYSDTASMLTNYARKNYFNLQNVTNNGNITTNSIVSNWLGFGYNGSLYNQLFGYGDSFSFLDSNGINLLASSHNALSLFHNPDNDEYVDILIDGLTGYRSISIPDASGTFALRGDSTIFDTKYRSDSGRTNIYSTLNTKLNKSDSSIYQTKYRTDTMRINVYNQFLQKVNLSDSNAIYQTKYRTDTARVNIYATLNGKLNISDSSTYQTKYRTDTARTNIYNALNGKQSTLTNPVTGTGTSGSIVKFSGTSTISNATADVDYLANDMGLVAYQAMGSSLKGYNIGCPNIANATSGIALGNQTTTYVAIYVPTSITVTGIKYWQNTQGNYTASNYNGVGLYQSIGDSITLIASSTNDGNIWKGASTSFQTKAFSSTVAISPGIYYIGALYSRSAETTAPAIGFSGTASAGTINLGVIDFTNGNKMNGTAGSGLTAFANKIAKSAITATQHRLAFYLY